MHVEKTANFGQHVITRIEMASVPDVVCGGFDPYVVV